MSTFTNIGAIVRKEWLHYFGSPIAYVALFTWNLLFSLFFVSALTQFIEYAGDPRASAGGGPKPNINEWIFGWVLSNMTVVALFVAPMFSMRLFAEEQRQGTWELLATSPITDWQIVIGKFIGATSMYALLILTSLLNFLPVWRYADPAPSAPLLGTAVLAVFLVGTCFIALGELLSTLTKNQIIAGMLSFGLALTTWVLSYFDKPMASDAMKALTYLSVLSHMEDLVRGVIDTKDLFFYASFIGFALFLTQQSVESRRWRE